jgi:hypothetical protein
MNKEYVKFVELLNGLSALNVATLFKPVTKCDQITKELNYKHNYTIESLCGNLTSLTETLVSIGKIDTIVNETLAKLKECDKVSKEFIDSLIKELNESVLLSLSRFSCNLSLVSRIFKISEIILGKVGSEVTRLDNEKIKLSEKKRLDRNTLAKLKREFKNLLWMSNQDEHVDKIVKLQLANLFKLNPNPKTIGDYSSIIKNMYAFFHDKHIRDKQEIVDKINEVYNATRTSDITGSKLLEIEKFYSTQRLNPNGNIVEWHYENFVDVILDILEK